VGKEIEIITQCIECIFMNSGFAFTNKVRKDSPVLSEQTMNIPYKVIGITVKPVVKVVPALIGTEFLIGAATKNIAAIETFPFHSTKVSINIQKNRIMSIELKKKDKSVYKRLQMTLTG
jgi:hypothetical protein